MKKRKSVSILVVDDDNTHRFMLRAMLKEWGLPSEEADDGSTAVAAVRKKPFDAILMDVRMVHMDGMEALKQIKAYNPAIPVIIMTAYSSIDSAVSAIKKGADDYLTKPLDFDKLKLTLTRTLDHCQIADKNIKSQQQKRPASQKTTIDHCGIIGDSQKMRKLLDMISYVAPTDATVLITGASGTGKELIAKALHKNSARKDKPFITVNCAALVENLLESELFGHEKGAFTGADRQRDGKFIQADGGTLFLDEISETSQAMQAKLLRVLQEHELQRVGGGETLAIDVRVLAASNRNLQTEASSGSFRHDLYYRLNVITLHVPPLKDRKHDIPLLATHFMDKFATKNNRTILGITPGCMNMLLRYSWPGNIRELENAIERGVILMRSDYLDEASMPIPIQTYSEQESTVQSATPAPASLAAAEKIVIQKTLKESDGNKSETARRLNITRKTLLSKLKKYKISP